MRNLLVLTLVTFVYCGMNAFAGEPSPEEASLNNLNDTLKGARAVPYVDPATGKMKGYVVQSKKSKKNFENLELRQGDTLTGVNELPNETVEQDQEAK